MKYLLVIGDGMADNPVPALDGKTPLQAAKKPVLDRLTADGTLDLVRTVPVGMPAGSETAILAILGCDPATYFTGRSPMEAAAAGLPLVDGDVAFRCNLMSYEDTTELPLAQRKMRSYNAASVEGQDALDLVDALLADERFVAVMKRADMELHKFPMFRQIVVQHNADISGITFFPPQDHQGEPCGNFYPCGNERAEIFCELMRLSNEILQDHPVNQRRRAEGMVPANGIWFWGQGTTPNLPAFAVQYGMQGAVVSGTSLCKGIGTLRGMDVPEVEGANGELNTNYEGKVDWTWKKLQEYDFACVHLEAPDECSHARNLEEKIEAIELLDSRVIAPLVDRLEKSGEDFRILILSDHKTLVTTGGHDGDPIPYLIYDSRKKTGCGKSFDEETGEKGVFLADGSRLLDILFEK